LLISKKMEAYIRGVMGDLGLMQEEIDRLGPIPSSPSEIPIPATFTEKDAARRALKKIEDRSKFVASDVGAIGPAVKALDEGEVAMAVTHATANGEVSALD
jgi:hypothetical protein